MGIAGQEFVRVWWGGRWGLCLMRCYASARCALAGSAQTSPFPRNLSTSPAAPAASPAGPRASDRAKAAQPPGSAGRDSKQEAATSQGPGPALQRGRQPAVGRGKVPDERGRSHEQIPRRQVRRRARPIQRRPGRFGGGRRRRRQARAAGGSATSPSAPGIAC